MERPDDLTPEQEAILAAEDAVQDDILGNLKLICGEGDAEEMLAEIIKLALLSPIKGGSAADKNEMILARLQTKCLDWFDLMVHKKAGL